MDTEGKKKSKYTVSNLIWLMVIIFVVWLVYASFLYLLSDKWDHRGAFGDMFGAINALFSGLAFAGIIFAIFMQKDELKIQINVLEMQRKELELQRKELELARIEFKRTASAQEASQKELSKQAENLRKTAQINAINTLIGIKQEKLKKPYSEPVKIQIITNIESLELKLEVLLENLDKE
jgi:uncharacterized membrane protein